MIKKRRFKGGQIPTSSMADIAFLLLIFFLVTTTIDMDKGLGIVLPAEGEEIEIKKDNILNCLINSRGDVLLGGEPVKTRDLNKEVRRKIAENNKLIISVKAHEKTKYSDYIAVIESRGFVIGSILADKFNKGLILLRSKPGRLPGETSLVKHTLEYGKSQMEVQNGKGKVLIFDDVLATGGTAKATGNIVKKLEGEIVSYGFLIVLSGLNGRDVLKPEHVFTILEY